MQLKLRTVYNNLHTLALLSRLKVLCKISDFYQACILSESREFVEKLHTDRVMTMVVDIRLSVLSDPMLISLDTRVHTCACTALYCALNNPLSKICRTWLKVSDRRIGTAIS